MSVDPSGLEDFWEWLKGRFKGIGIIPTIPGDKGSPIMLPPYYPFGKPGEPKKEDPKQPPKPDPIIVYPPGGPENGIKVPPGGKLGPFPKDKPPVVLEPPGSPGYTIVDNGDGTITIVAKEPEKPKDEKKDDKGGKGKG